MCVGCPLILELEIVVMGISSPKGDMAQNTTKKVFLEKTYVLPPPTFLFLGTINWSS